MRVSLSSFDPEWSVPGYSAKDALSLCLASRVAYGRQRDDVVRLGFSDVEFFDIVRGHDIDTQGYIAINEERVLVAFRGTESIPDWLTNFQAVRDPGPWKDTNVHEGFQDAFGAAALKIGEIIGRRRGSREVWVTGHSLGGALAVLLAATLAESKTRVTGLYTFAAPRVGNKRFAARLNAYLRTSAHWRVVNEGDVVPHVPPEMFFSHAGGRVLLRDNGSVSESPEAWTEFKEGIWGWIGKVMGSVKLKLAGPHRLGSRNGYLQRLAKQVP